MELVAEQAPRMFLSFCFAFGAVVGSFLNVVIARVPEGLSVVSPPSRCPRCKSGIAWYDNVPIVSWLVLRAKCRSCGLPIASRYPLVELLGGVLAVAIFHHLGPTLEALGAFAFAATLLALAFIDLDTWLLPHQLTWPLLGVGLLSPLWNHAITWRESALGAAVGFALFAAIALFGEKVLKRETMGWGDVWLLGGIGGWLGVYAVFPVVMLSALQGAVVGGGLILVGRAMGKREENANANANANADANANANADANANANANADANANANANEVLPDDDDWTPPPHAVPYGPFLALAALEQLLLGDAIWSLWDEWVHRIAS